VIYFQTSEEGAQTSIYLTVSEDVAKTSGKYFKDCKVNMILIRHNILFNCACTFRYEKIYFRKN